MILVTGGAGYIGSHTVKYLINQGERVLVFDNLSTGHLETVEYLRDAIFVRGDLASSEELDKLFVEYPITGVIHFAASSIVSESMSEPEKYFRNNVINTLNLLESMRKAKVKNIIFSSTAAVYGEPTVVPISEKSPLQPTNVYGLTKLQAEQIIETYVDVYGFKACSLRYFNAAGADPEGLLGEDHNPETHLIPLVLKVALGQLESIKVFGNKYPTSDGTCIRDYIHVEDLTKAHYLAWKSISREVFKGYQCFNLGSGNGFSVLEVIATSRKVTGHPIPLEIFPTRAGDPAVLVASSDRIKQELAWQAEYSLKDIIETAWRWHSNNPNGFKASKERV